MRRALRIGLWALAVPAVVALLLLAVIVALNTDPGRRFVERSTARLTGGHVLITGLAGRFPDDLRLAGLQLLDADGRWLDAEDLSLQWSPATLLRRRVTVRQVRVARLDIDRGPLAQAGSSGSSSRSLPRTVDIENLEIPLLNLGPSLAGTPATLTVRAHASLRSFDDASFELTADRLNGPGRYRVQFAVGAGHVAGALDVAEPAGGALANLLQLPGLGDLQATAHLDGPPGAERLELDAAAGELRVAASGTLDWPHRSADLSLSAHSPAMALRPDLGWRQLDVDGHWRGGLDARDATLTAAVAGLHAAGFDVAAVNADARGSAGQLHATVQANGVRIPGAHPDLLATAPLLAVIDMDLRAEPRRATYSLTHVLAKAQGTITVAPFDAELTAQLPALAPLAALADLQLQGSATLHGRYRGGAAQGNVSAESTLNIAGGSAPFAVLAGHAAKIALGLTWQEGELRIDKATFNGVSAQLAVDGSRSARQVWDLRWRASIEDLARLSGMLAGEARGQGTLRGPAGDLRADAVISADASFHDSPRGPLQLTVAARGLPSQLSADIGLQGTLDAAPLRLDTSLRRDAAGMLHVTVPRGDWKSAHVDGELAWNATDPARQAPRGRLQLQIARLEDLQSLTGQQLSGQLDATLESAATGSNEMALRLAAQNLRFDDYTADVRLDGRGTTRAIAVELTAQVRGTPQGDTGITGAGSVDFERQRVQLSALRVQYRGETLQLRDSAQLRYGEVVALDHLRLALRQAELNIDGELSPILNVHVTLQDVSPATLRPLLADTSGFDVLPAEGRLAGDAMLKGSLSEPQGSVQLQATGLRWNRGIAEGLPALEFSARSELRGSQPAKLTMQLRAGPGTELDVDGEVPLEADATLAMRMRGKADLSMANGFLEAGGRRAGGQLEIDGRVGGTLAAPDIGGTAILRNGDLQDYTVGLHLAAIGATIEASRDTLKLTQFSAKAGSGTIEGSGTIGLLQPDLPVALHFTTRDAQPVNSNLITARINADLRLDGTWNRQLQLSGKADISRAEITIPNALPVTVATLDVRRPGEKRAPVVVAAHPLRVDVTISAPRAVFVRGRGLDAELGGELHWGGTRLAPQIAGGFELRTGRFNLVGKTLEFQTGRVSFNGQGVTNQFDPTLDFVASNTSGGVTSTLKITGYADRPIVTLESSPELPQDEVLAHLLFGTGVTQLGTLQLAQMGAAIATLGGISISGVGSLLAVQRNLGLDRLSISDSGTEEGGATLEAGRYVSSRVYLGTRQSSNGASQARVEVDLSKGLKAHATIGTGAESVQGNATSENAGNSVGLSYEFEY